MSYEAVPCKIRAPAQDGTNGTKEIIGIIIRPSNSQDGSRVNVVPTPPGVIPIKGSKPFIIGPGSSRSLIISNDQIPKVVMRGGGQMRVSSNPIWNPIPSTSGTSRVTTPQLKVTSPQSVDMGCSPSSWNRVQSSMDGATSSTPDSGIQSVPTTPPMSTALSKVEEKAEEGSKFDDMPRLLPVDHDNSAASESPSIPPTLDESAQNQASECESALPSSISNTSWNPQEIATQLLSMAAFDPAKIQEVTALMLQRSKEDGKKKEAKRKTENIKSPIETKKKRIEHPESVPSTSRQTPTVKRESRAMSEEDQKRSESEPRDEESSLVMYRMAMRRRMIAKVEETTENVMENLTRLSIGDRRKKRIQTSINPLFSPLQWELINSKPKVTLSETVKNYLIEKRRIREEKEKKRTIERKRRKEPLKKEQKQSENKMKRRGEENRQEYNTIHNNELLCPLSLPSISSSLHCECSRGGCLSTDCITRSSRIFCSQSSCSLPSCSNRLSLPSTLILSKGVLKTKEPRKAHHFLGEMVGEVISVRTMINRISSPSSSSSSIRAFSISPLQFLDCTRKGGITRFVKHSCHPNSALQIWWESGIPHLCLFSLFPLASNSEVTVDLSFLTPLPFDCHCSSRGCRRSIPQSTVISLHNSIHSLPSTRLFVKRNLRVSRIRSVREEKTLSDFYLIIDQRFRRTDGKVNREYADLLHKLRIASEKDEVELFVSIISQMEQLTQQPIDTHSLSCIRHRLERGVETKDEEEKERKKSRKMEKYSNRRTDITYLDSHVSVGSYNPDSWKGADRSTNDAVRCVCGVLEDDGEMVECDECHFWLHSDCVANTSTDSYSCPLCLAGNSTPHGDIQLKNQPSIRLDGCVYYKALENSKKMQIRQNECVYVRRLKSDNHKKIIRGIEHKKSKSVLKDEPIMSDEDRDGIIPPRSLLRVFRVERLFESPGGHRFLFGFYYARPHETFCDESRLFHPNEVFATPFYDTLPLDAVEGKCVVMEASLYCAGRPIFPSYKEQDVLVCEYQLDRNQRHFDKCKNTYFINTESYAFQKFERARSLQRCFTPFTYSSSTPGTIATWSQEDTSRFLRQQSTKRINHIAKRITTSTHV